MIEVIIGSTEELVARSFIVLDKVEVISACCWIMPEIGLLIGGGVVGVVVWSGGSSMMSAGVGGSLIAIIWSSDWLWLSKREF